MEAEQKQKLPDGWKWAKLGEVCRIFTGSSAPQGKEYFDSLGPFFVRVSDIGIHGRTIKLSISQDRLSQLALNSCKLVLARKKTVLFPKSGAAISTNNRAMLDVDAYIVSHLMGLEAEEKVLPQWIYYALCQIDMMDYSDNTGYPSLKKSVVEKIEIPLPPLPEQKQIAGILTKQMAAAEKAQKACEEKLCVAQRLPDSYLCAVFNSPESKTWSVKKVEEICEITARQVDPKIPEYGNLPHVNGENIESGTRRLTFLKTAKELKMISGKYLFERGDVLYSKLRPYLRKVFVADFKGVCSADMYPICVNKAIADPSFFAWLLLSDDFTRYANEESMRARMPKLNRKQLFAWKAKLPSLKEQRRLVEILEKQASRVETLCKKIESELETIKRLPASLLQQAFKGKL